MDILDYLKTDHERVKTLFNDFQRSHDPQRRRQLLNEIRVSLQGHLEIEETVFYPAFSNYPEFKDLLSSSYADHNSVKDLWNQMKSTDTKTPEFEQRFRAMIEEVEQHIAREEQEFFPKVRHVLNRPEREKMGRLVQTIRPERKAA